MRYSSIVVIIVCILAFILIKQNDHDQKHGAVTKQVNGQAAAVSIEVAKTADDYKQSWETIGDNLELQASLIEKAEERRTAFLALMESDPEEAIRTAISLSDYVSLPDELQPYFEKPLNALGDIDLLWKTGAPDEHGRSCQHYNTVNIEDKKLRAYGADRHILPVLKNTYLSGISLGDVAVITDSSLYRLSDDAGDTTNEMFPKGLENDVDPLTGGVSSPDHAAVIGGKVYEFESDQILTYVEETLKAAVDTADDKRQAFLNQPFEWLAGNTSGDDGEATEATPYQEDQIDVLFIRVDFSDFPGSPISQTDLQTTLATVDGHLDDYSYGQAGITYTVTSQLYRMPSTGADYATDSAELDGIDGNDRIQDDARSLAAANYTLSNYDVIAIYFPNLGGVSGSLITYGGLASVGGANHWINGFNSVDIILHEFGHNYGLYHANYYHPEQQLAGSYGLPDSLEYGDIFDIMGNGDAPEGHFSHLAKNYLDWLPDNKVAEATSDGTYTIYRFDDSAALSNPTLALKIPIQGDINYWVGYRQLYTSSTYNLSNGAYVVAENLAQNRETSLIDMTPESQTSETNDRRDAGLSVGDSYYNNDAGVTINAIASGGTSPNQWIDIEVVFEPRISVAEASMQVDEQSGVAHVVLQREFSSVGEITVNYATSDGTATEGTDYYSTAGTITWEDGDDSDKTVVIPIRPDVTNEGSEDFTLTLSSVIGGKLDAEDFAATISILDAGQRFSSFDPSFFYYTVRSIVPLDSGKVLIGGNFADGSGSFANDINHIARLNADGSVDTSFIQGTGFDAPVHVMHKQPDGKILVGGEFTSYNGTTCNRIVRLLENGAIDTSFVTASGAGANNTVRAIAIEGNNDILIGGDFTTYNGGSDLGLARLTSTGARDTGDVLNQPFNSSFGVNIYSILAEDSGKIMVSGSFYVNSTGTGFRSGIARLNSNGTRDTSFDPDAGAHSSSGVNNLRTVYDMEKQSDGKYVLVGSFTAYDDNNTEYCARISSDGSYDSAFNVPAFNNTILTSLYQASGSVVVGGQFTQPANQLERLATNGASDSNFDQGAGAGGTVYSLAEGIDREIWVGGNFFTYDGATSRPIVKIAGGLSPYDVWVQTQFTSAEITAGDAAENADPDGDGIENIAEMAFGTDPNVANSEPFFGVSNDGGITLVTDNGEDYLQISLDKTTLSEGAWFIAQFGDDLATWAPVSPTPTSNSTYDIIENSAATFTVRDKTPISPNNMRFGRIGVQTPE